MEKFVLLILCSSLSSIRANECTPNLPPCSDVHDIATIKCVTLPPEALPEDVACTITCETEDGACTEEIAGLLGQDENKIDAGICKEKCREQSKLPGAELLCEFYRWEEEDEGKCVLQTECGKPDMRCQSDDEPRCITGQIGCTEDGTTACSLESPVVYEPLKFHLICRSGTGDINIYSYDEITDIPTGTVCYTIHMCAEWNDFMEDTTYYRKLAVSCSAEGTWQKVDGTGGGDESKDMIVGNTLVEPTCGTECVSMTLIDDNIHAEGTELICEENLIGVNLENGNSCVLICDNHFAMSISCEFEHEGTKAWMDENRRVVAGEAVKC